MKTKKDKSLAVPAHVRPTASARLTGERVDLSAYLSWQSVALLDQLTALGLYGLTREDVAARFVDKELCRITSREELQELLKKHEKQ